MPSLSRAQILDLWERGSRRHTLERALILYSATEPGVSLERLADVPIGRRDQALLELYRAKFGSTLRGFVDCPNCRTRLEFSLDADSLQTPAVNEAIEAGGLTVRRPTTRDLASVMNDPDPAYRLAQRCCTNGDGPLPALTAAQVAEIDAALADADAAGDVVLDLICVGCQCASQAVFDAGAFLWQEVESQARKLLADVHTLAQAYGWTENEVLALGDARRAAYIDMVLA